jgi:hypothetical protein
MLIAHDCSSRLRYSRKRDVRSASFPGCNTYIALVEKNSQEAFSTEQQ